MNQSWELDPCDPMLELGPYDLMFGTGFLGIGFLCHNVENLVLVSCK